MQLLKFIKDIWHSLDHSTFRASDSLSARIPVNISWLQKPDRLKLSSPDLLGPSWPASSHWLDQEQKNTLHLSGWSAFPQSYVVERHLYVLQHSPFYNWHKISSCHLSSPPALEGQPMICSWFWLLVFEPTWKLGLHLLIHKLGKLLIMLSDRWGVCTSKVLLMVCKHLPPFQQKGTQLLMLLLGQIRSITKKAHLPW